MGTMWIALAVAVTLFFWMRTGRKTNYPVPPGPKPMFFIGNVRDLTSNQLWLRAQQWYREYGEDSYLIWWYNWLTLSFFS